MSILDGSEELQKKQFQCWINVREFSYLGWPIPFQFIIVSSKLKNLHFTAHTIRTSTRNVWRTVRRINTWEYSFKIFPRFWLVKPTRIIHHNQLLLTKFEKNLCHIEPMTSKVQPAADYWTDDVKMTSKVQPAADYWTVDRENLGTRLCYIWWAEKQRAKWRNSFKNEEIFWMNNKAVIEFGFRRIWRILQISESVIHLGLWPLLITPSLICRILHAGEFWSSGKSWKVMEICFKTHSYRYEAELRYTYYHLFSQDVNFAIFIAIKKNCPATKVPRKLKMAEFSDLYKSTTSSNTSRRVQIQVNVCPYSSLSEWSYWISSCHNSSVQSSNLPSASGSL